MIGIAAAWLGCAGGVRPPLSGTPYVELQLPPRASAARTETAAPGGSGEVAAASPETPPAAETDEGPGEDTAASDISAEPRPAAPAASPPPETAAIPATAAEPPPAPEPPALESPLFEPPPAPAPPAAASAAETPEAPAAAAQEPPATEPAATEPAMPELAAPTTEPPTADMTAAKPLSPAASPAEAGVPPVAVPAPEPTASAPSAAAPVVTDSAKDRRAAEPAPAAKSPETAPSPAAQATAGPAATAPADNGPGPATAPQVAAAGVPPGVTLSPWQRYARPFPADDPRPRIAVIVAELGLAEAATQAAIERLPAQVTLSFNPYGARLQAWIDAARSDGHEVLLGLPMEPVSYPRDDPGPKALFTALPEAENEARLAWALGRAEGYVGVVPWMGSRFSASAEDLRPILAEIGKRGLMFVDARPSADSVAARVATELDLPHAVNDRFLDHVASRAAIDGRLAQIEQIARRTGFAVAMASPYPITIECLASWISTLDRKGFVLAPISALVGRQAAE